MENQGKNETFRVALLIPPIGEYERGLLKGIAEYAQLHGPWYFLRNKPYYILPNQHEISINQLIEWKPDGIILSENNDTQKIIDTGIPVVISGSTKIYNNCINILSNDKKIGAIGAEYFIRKGYRNLAFVGSSKLFWSIDRYEGFKASIQNIQTLHHFQFEWDNDQQQNNFDNLYHWLFSLPKPIGLLACSDHFSQIVLDACIQKKIKVPDQVAILGVDNDELICKIANPALSSIDQYSTKTGIKAASALHEWMKNSTIDFKRQNIHSEFFSICSRPSTDILAVQDKEIVKALKFIENLDTSKTISIEAVVNQTFLSRRVLEMKFRKYLGKTIGEEIRAKRMKEIEKLLLFTNFNITEIAYKCGFSSDKNIASFFKKHHNISPLEFRKLYK